MATKVYHKKTDDKMYLHYNSAYPKSQKDAIPYSLFIRCKRICTEKRHFFIEVQDITQNLACRGYPHELIVKSFQKANQQNRDDLLLINKENLTMDKKIRLITTYNTHNSSNEGYSTEIQRLLHPEQKRNQIPGHPNSLQASS